jgi:hypothetical protein
LRQQTRSGALQLAANRWSLGMARTNSLRMDDSSSNHSTPTKHTTSSTTTMTLVIRPTAGPSFFATSDAGLILLRLNSHTRLLPMSASPSPPWTCGLRLHSPSQCQLDLDFFILRGPPFHHTHSFPNQVSVVRLSGQLPQRLRPALPDMFFNY